MNKYQEAFDTLLCKVGTDDDICFANKERKIKRCIDCNTSDSIKEINKLVDRATPMKIKVERIVFPDTLQEFKRYTSPCCGYCIGDNYIGILEIPKFCPKCGQALRSDEDET